MIIEKQAQELAPEVMDVATKIEIYCPACSRDVDEAELAAKKCNDCGHSLAEPEQHVAIVVANLSSGGQTL